MSVNNVNVNASPDDVFRILSTAKRYADWIYGAKDVRDVDLAWPSTNAAFHHTVSLGLLRSKDEDIVSGHFHRPKRWLGGLLWLRNEISLRRLKTLVEAS